MPPFGRMKEKKNIAKEKGRRGSAFFLFFGKNFKNGIEVGDAGGKEGSADL